MLLDTNILKENAASTFRARSDPVGGSMFLCKTGVCDAHPLTYEGDLSWYEIMMYKLMCLKDNVLQFGNNK